MQKNIHTNTHTDMFIYIYTYMSFALSFFSAIYFSIYFFCNFATLSQMEKATLRSDLLRAVRDGRRRIIPCKITPPSTLVAGGWLFL